VVNVFDGAPTTTEVIVRAMAGVVFFSAQRPLE
jgi:hypothetical protein